MDRKQASSGTIPGVLYVVATPIGNLEDMTFRALRTLREVDLVVAENFAHTRGLCDHYGIKAKITAYNQHSRNSKTERLIKQLKTGTSMALVSDAGTPGISDPGIMLITGAVEQGVCITPVPGPCAAVAGLSVCGFSTAGFRFLGFLSNRSGKRKRELQALASETQTMVFYESCHRIRATLLDMVYTFGTRKMVMLREMTKIFEEIRRGTATQLLEILTQENTRGEFTLVVSGMADEKLPEALNEAAYGEIAALLNEKTMSIKDIASFIAENQNLAYRKVYKACLAEKRRLEDS